MTKQYGFLVDLDACYGCKTCSMACKTENATPYGVSWRNVREFKTQNPNSLVDITMSCNHCDDPKCMEVCPANTYSKRADGIVVQDHEKCVGCQMCIMACPYDAPKYDAAKGKTSKCDMCATRLDVGLQPRCVESCPAGVIKFGPIDELRAQYGDTNWVELEKRFGMPDHTITNPNIILMTKSV
ncbi:4Fe-4S ferredoxin [Vibrio sp. MACH09]|uniref:4Fe-4S dicluster domain-containing protein n=1 Tax=unclassified Vibrio TaxID=2614977 RepID=UPI001493B012|nr:MULTISPECIES: 4Fe-4S dicluster domain-containing protein [unclassified Vibrio]GLO60547.1 4Fe-4S ferredoxin [Vibrio sp. MACH09]